MLWVIATGGRLRARPAASPANGYGDHSPGGYSLLAVRVTEVVLTGVLPARDPGRHRHPAPPGFAPLAIGLALTLIHLVSIPVTNTSVNPARSTGPALFAGAEALGQLWLFWLAPIVGGADRRLGLRLAARPRRRPGPLEVATEA